MSNVNSMPKFDQDRFASDLRSHRARLRMSLMELANIAGVDASEYFCYEDGVAPPQLATYARLCKWLGVSCDTYLINETLGADHIRNLRTVASVLDDINHFAAVGNLREIERLVCVSQNFDKLSQQVREAIEAFCKLEGTHSDATTTKTPAKTTEAPVTTPQEEPAE